MAPTPTFCNCLPSCQSLLHIFSTLKSSINRTSERPNILSIELKLVVTSGAVLLNITHWFTQKNILTYFHTRSYTLSSVITSDQFESLKRENFGHCWKKMLYRSNNFPVIQITISEQWRPVTVNTQLLSTILSEYISAQCFLQVFFFLPLLNLFWKPTAKAAANLSRKTPMYSEMHFLLGLCYPLTRKVFHNTHFSTWMPLVGRQEKYPAHKNFCFNN